MVSRMNLDALRDRLKDRRRTMLGYPLDQTPFPMDHLIPFYDLLINNLGDPWEGGTYGVNTFDVEREVLITVAKMFHLSHPRGYVTSCGTEGNIRGITNGFRRYPSAVAYASDKVHYSVAKACDIANRPLQKIPSDPYDRISVDALLRAIKRNNNRPAVICLTVGTVMSGALDDVESVAAAINNLGIRAYIHVDAALSGYLLPPLRGVLPSVPIFDFSVEAVDSLSVSNHKMLGVKIPSGVFLSRKNEGDRIDYIDSTDSTIGGSRCGLAVLMAWYALEHFNLKDRALSCMKVAEYAHGRITESNRWPWSNMVTFKKPSQWVINKWQLAVNGQDAHIICMPHVSYDLIDEFVDDLVKEGGMRRLVTAR